MVSDRFNTKTLLTFSKGPGGGQDAAGCCVQFKDEDGNILTNQNLVVQVKHTKNELNIINKNVYRNEKKKVKELVQKGQLDIYVLFTNYKIPGGQSVKIVEYFKDAGAKNVLPVGKGTLSQWLNDSQELQRNVIRQYPDLIDGTSEQSSQMLERYREDLKKTVDVETFTKAKEIVESDKGLVFITGVPGSGKTTVAKQLVVHLSQEYDFFDINNTEDFIKKWIPNQKQVFFIDNIDSDDMKKWCKLEDKLGTAIAKGSKFVFAGETVVLEEALSSLNKFNDLLSKAAINLSDEQFNLSKEKKQEMLKKHVEMGDNDNLTKEALLKDDMVSYAAEINCPCFPLVAKSFGSRGRLEKFKEVGFAVYNQEFLDQFFKWVQSTTVDSISSSESCESPMPNSPTPYPRLESDSIPGYNSDSTPDPNSDSTSDYNSDSIHESDNRDNITGSTSESCESPPPKRPRLQSEPRSTAANGDNITGLLTNNNFNCLKPVITQLHDTTCRIGLSFWHVIV